ncbi:hemin-degrading factor [Jannaschia pagri]|uniref:Hemin-degrading factor n=1 Tax=Jannaschia pagri TaxID=2829797 RepID=A0ABQ4NRJ5_9RHOB|nr:MULTISPECIES: ChuX/HutX family heme-like substrate-binding protein [unclassified Jannaschia]GIT93200.1 hemin-degrading factor [Jannaschia sp. AI_61]GIT97033.1 hemin-degrading factor [Jannaschia sp. AI_62]
MSLQTVGSEARMTVSAIRDAIDAAPPLRERELAARIGISEAELLEARGDGWRVARIDATPGRLIPAVEALGDAMALTRNDWCVSEKIGRYTDFHDGKHAAMTVNPDIDTRMFPQHWVHGFHVEKDTEDSLRRSLQVFDGAGQHVHKVHLTEGSDLAVWAALREDLAVAPAPLAPEPAPAPEGARTNPDRVEVLRREWAKLTDTHQFLMLCRKVKMNRLGAYRVAGAPFVRALQPSAFGDLIRGLSAGGVGSMVFVGNRGCIQIHSGPMDRIAPMGPWLNVMDPRFNLHLRDDKVAEVWAVEKPTKRGPALSVEAFDADGTLIAQIFGLRKEDGAVDETPAFRKIVDTLPDAETAA